MLHRPHEVIAIGGVAAEALGITVGNFVYLSPQVLNPKTGLAILLELDIKGLCFDFNYIIGSALYSEPYEKQDADREVERVRQDELEKSMIGPKSRN
jgi:hypothetical protein